MFQTQKGTDEPFSMQEISRRTPGHSIIERIRLSQSSQEPF
jgi:hypothetical protein